MTLTESIDHPNQTPQAIHSTGRFCSFIPLITNNLIDKIMTYQEPQQILMLPSELFQQAFPILQKTYLPYFQVSLLMQGNHQLVYGTLPFLHQIRNTVPICQKYTSPFVEFVLLLRNANLRGATLQPYLLLILF